MPPSCWVKQKYPDLKIINVEPERDDVVLVWRGEVKEQEYGS
jgi:hypothetical protein